MAANRILQQLMTTFRGRKVIAGNFVTNNTSSPTAANQLYDLKGCVARTGVGTHTITFPAGSKWSTCEALWAFISLAAVGAGTVCQCSYNASTGVVTIVNQTGGSAADTTGATIHFIAVFSDRST
jgi:hypothetical protein